MNKTYDEINEKIKKRKAVVVTADEIADLVDRQGIDKTTQTVDVVTTGTFGPMCSSGQGCFLTPFRFSSSSAPMESLRRLDSSH